MRRRRVDVPVVDPHDEGTPRDVAQHQVEDPQPPRLQRRLQLLPHRLDPQPPGEVQGVDSARVADALQRARVLLAQVEGGRLGGQGALDPAQVAVAHGSRGSYEHQASGALRSPSTAKARARHPPPHVS